MKIPKIFHSVWLGPKPLAKEHQEYRKQWKALHPDWDMWFWTDEDVPKLINQDIYNIVDTYAGRSDVLRYEILYNIGGVYIDIDYQPLKNIELVIEDFEFFCSRDAETWTRPGRTHPGIRFENYFNTALMGATKGNPIIKKLIDEMPEWVANCEDNPGASNQTGPTFVSWILLNEDVPALPVSTFNGDYAIHNYLGSWAKTIEEENKKSWRNIFRL